MACGRCGGTGRVSFSRDGGVCYGCRGSGRGKPAPEARGETCAHGALVRLRSCLRCRRGLAVPQVGEEG